MSQDKIVEKLNQTDDPDVPMPLFSSVRERRLWVCTLAVIVAIYSTLGLTTTLVEVLRNRELFDGTFLVGFLLIWVAILTQGLKVRPRGTEISVGLGVMAVYLMVFARMGIPERTHLIRHDNERMIKNMTGRPALLVCILATLLPLLRRNL